MPLRIIVKTDYESGTGRGAVLYRQHFEPRMAKLTAAIAEATAELLPEAIHLRMTEGYRPPRVAGKRDKHSTMEAIDYTVVFTGGRRASFEQYSKVAERARALVGDAEYDFLVHGEVSNGSLHIHAEYDPH